MSEQQTEPTRGRSGNPWLRRYPPLITFGAVLLIMLAIMPSALNLPQANPSTVLEYAPVPPEDEDPPPQSEGSLSSLSLGSSNTVETGIKPPDPDLGTAKGERPITKNCVGDPPRQTEDPNSPPCVPFYEGDNGGETWQGVTGDEIRVIFYTSDSLSVPDPGEEDPPEESPAAGTYCDIDDPPDSNPECLDQVGGIRDHNQVREVRALSTFFNKRFQSYGRHIHFYVYYSSGAATPASRRSDAHGNWETIQPFAVIDYAFFGGYNEVYADAMARRKVLVFSNFSGLANSIYKANAPYLWTFWPDVEHWAEQYTSYLCQKVIPFDTVKHAGGTVENGQPRRYGFLSTNDEGYPGLQRFASLVKANIRRGCPGGHRANVVGEWYFPNAQYSVDNDPAALQAARQNVAEMQTSGVTTVLWAGGQEVAHGSEMNTSQYFPEIIMAGDLINDFGYPAQHQDQNAFEHAWLMTNRLREDRAQDVPCVNAYREADPGASRDDVSAACGIYRSFHMVFRSIQVAGPFLTPDAVDQGNHAVPKLASLDPYTAACFFDPGDYSCVKDAHESWYDPSAPDPDGDPGERGCWRIVDGGKRYLAGTWEGDDTDVFKDSSDPCNNGQGEPFQNATGGL
jgi:hypothetical protein